MASIADQYINEYLAQKFFSMFGGRMDVFAKRAKNGNYYIKVFDDMYLKRLIVMILNMKNKK